MSFKCTPLPAAGTDSAGRNGGPRSGTSSTSGNLKSGVLEHFQRDSVRQTAQCNLCKTNLKTGGGSTKSLHTHLLTKHHINVLKAKHDEDLITDECDDEDGGRCVGAISFYPVTYDDAFRPKRIRNWQTPKRFQEMPRTRSGSTKILADDKGHLRPEFHRSKTLPWGNFVGTWDLPKHLPGNRVDVPTSRSREANEQLQRDWQSVKMDVTGQRWGTFNDTFYIEGTRSYAPSVKFNSKFRGEPVELQIEDGSLYVPRRLSPIERPSSVLNQPLVTDAAAIEIDHSQRLNEHKVPLPELSKPIFME